MSTPKITKMNTEFLTCDGESVASVLLEYETPELLKIAQCDFRKVDTEGLRDIVSTLTRMNPVYEGFYVDEKSPQEIQSRMAWALDILASFGVDFALRKDLLSGGEYDDVFYDLVDTGHEQAIMKLLSMGLKPYSLRVLIDAALNVYQGDVKSQKIVESKTARRILEAMKPYFQTRPRASDVLLFHAGYAMSGTLTAAMSAATEAKGPEARNELNTSFTKLLIDLMVSEGFDFKSKSSEFNKSPIQVIQDSAEESRDPIYTKSQAQALIQQLRAAGAN